MKVIVKILLCSYILLLAACSGSQRDIPELSNGKTDVRFHHFYRLMPGETGAFNTDSIPAYLKQYPVFFELFTRYVIAIGGPEKKDFYVLANAFCSDPMIRNTYRDCIAKHGDLAAAEEGFTEAFSYYRHYFPLRHIPDVYFYQSGFNQSVLVDSNILGTAIDKYLGSNYELYHKLGLPRYQRLRMIPEMMVPDAMRAWIETEFPMPDSLNNLLNAMIYQGKIQYCMEHVMPYTHDTLLFAFSSTQWDWCANNEKKMWAWYAENKVLFETNPMEIRRFTEDGPFTTQFSKESPARTGVWTGWKIVKKYMEKHPDLTLEQLMHENDGQKILAGSGYNP